MRRLVALAMLATVVVPARATAGSISDTQPAPSTRTPRTEGLCDQPPVRDPRGDSAVDVLGVDITSDCKEWTYVVRFSRSRPERSSIRLEFDLDGNVRTGCRGADTMVVVTRYGEYDDEVSMFDMEGCARHQWTAVPHPSAEAASGTLTIRFGPTILPISSWFRWRVITSPRGSDVGGDVAPRGWSTVRLAASPVRSLQVDMRETVAEVTWAEPANTFGSPVLGYEVAHRWAGSEGWTIASLDRSARSLTIDGLRKGANYIFVVRATTRAGQGVARDVKATAFGVPGPPLDLAVVDDGVGGHRLTWKANPDRGGLRWVFYNVFMRTGSGAFVPLAFSAIVATSIDLPALTDGVRYTFRVSATNRHAKSPPVLLDYERPLARQGVSPTEFAALRRDRPSDSSAKPVPTRSWSYNGGVCDQRPLGDRRGDGPIDIVGVFVASNCDAWEFLVETARPVDFDDDDLLFVNLDTDLDTSTGCGGADVFIAVYQQYERMNAEAYRATGCSRESWTQLADGVVSFPLRAVRVVAWSSALGIRGPFRWYVDTHDGEGAAGSDYSPDRVWRSAAMPPGRVRSLVATAGDSSIAVSWAPPATDRGLPVTRYAVSYRVVGSERWRTVPTRGLATKVRFEAPARSQSYVVRVVAVNAFGQGNQATDTVVLVGPPSPVRDLAIEWRGDGLGIVTWKRPINDGQRPLTRYHATVSMDGGEPVVLKPNERLGTVRYIRDVEVGTTYTVTVWADNGAFAGEPTSVTITAS